MSDKSVIDETQALIGYSISEEAKWFAKESDGPAKILCVGNFASDVGYAWSLMERLWSAIAREYPGMVTVCWPTLRGVPDALRDCGAEFIEYDFDLNRADLTSFVRSHGFTDLYLTDNPYSSRAYLKLRAAGVRNIIVHDHAPGERSEPTGIRRALKTLAARFRPYLANAYIAVSDLGMRRFERSACLPMSRCHLAMNGVDLSIDPASSGIRSELGIAPSAVLVVSSSRALTYKGVQHIIEAARHVDAQFVHCGDGPDLDHFRSIAPPNFHLVGRRADVTGILAAADIAVHASSGEGLSLSILEFMRAGLAIVLPNSPTVAQSVVDGVSALLYEPGDVAQLAQRLTLLSSRPELRRALGTAAKLAVQRYNVENTVREVLGVFRALEIRQSTTHNNLNAPALPQT